MSCKFIFWRRVCVRSGARWRRGRRSWTRTAPGGLRRRRGAPPPTTCRSLASLARVFEAAPWCADPVLCAYGVVNTYPHDPSAFTQGLLVADAPAAGAGGGQGAGGE